MLFVHGVGSFTLASCEAACNGKAGCVVVNFHTKDKHCHVLSGSAPTHAAFMGGMKPSSKRTEAYDSCVLLKQ